MFTSHARQEQRLLAERGQIPREGSDNLIVDIQRLGKLSKDDLRPRVGHPLVHLHSLLRLRTHVDLNWLKLATLCDSLLNGGHDQNPVLDIDRVELEWSRGIGARGLRWLQNLLCEP